MINGYRSFARPVEFALRPPGRANRDAGAFRQVIDQMTEYGQSRTPDAIAGVESRGFMFGAPLAIALNCPFIPLRKLGKLPGETIREEYELEYGTGALELQKGAVQPGQSVLLVDDVLATGGTAAAATRIVERVGGEVAGCLFLVELTCLNCRGALASYYVLSLIEY